LHKDIPETYPTREEIPQILVDDDDAKDGRSDEGEVEELNIVLWDFNIQNNIDFILDEQEDSDYEFRKMRSIGEFD
jgi:hypothetical protein